MLATLLSGCTRIMDKSGNQGKSVDNLLFMPNLSTALYLDSAEMVYGELFVRLVVLAFGIGVPYSGYSSVVPDAISEAGMFFCPVFLCAVLLNLLQVGFYE